MKIPQEFLVDADAMPKKLRALLDAELAAGNEITEVFHSFPAPPAGACFRLARAVSTRPRESSGGIDFYDRNSSLYSGEFTDAKRFYFIIEPPNPPPPEPDMDAIRAAHAPKPWVPTKPKRRNSKASSKYPDLRPEPLPPMVQELPTGNDAVSRFRRSMAGSYDQWHDGVGYDLEVLKTATPAELVEIENLLMSRGIRGWRDVEALAALDTPRARVLLQQASNSSNPEISTAVISHAPHLLSDNERTRSLVKALRNSKIYEGLTQALLEVEAFHPPAVMDELLRGVRRRDGETAVHLAAMLMYLHGKADSSFDWSLRPFFLKFNTEDRAERQALYTELCTRIGVKPKAALKHR